MWRKMVPELHTILESSNEEMYHVLYNGAILRFPLKQMDKARAMETL